MSLEILIIISMRKIISVILVILPSLILGQGKKFHQLNNKDKPYYTEFNHFLSDSLWRFNQTIAYEEPNTFDEESWSRLVIEIKDTAAFLKIKQLDFKDECLMVKYYFASWNVWFHNRDSTSISGQIQLDSVTQQGVSLKLDLVVTNLKTANQFIYRGERLFRKTTTIQDFYKH